MKKLLMVAALAAVFAGCVNNPEKANTQLSKDDGYTPKMEAGDPNPYAQYGAAMAPNAKMPMAVEWHNQVGAALAKETEVEELKKQVLLPKTADDLLAQVKVAYETDPMVMTKIAAVSQIVMCRKWDKAPAARQLWTSALLNAAGQAPDEYRKLFFLDQLRWCGKANQADKVLAVGRKSGSKAVNDFAMMVATELINSGKEAK